MFKRQRDGEGGLDRERGYSSFVVNDQPHNLVHRAGHEQKSPRFVTGAMM